MSDVTTEPSTPVVTSTPTAPPIPERGPPWVVLGAVAVSFALLVWWGWRSFRPRPTLGPAMTMYISGRFPEAERKLSDYLSYDPQNQDARLALADVQMSLAPPKPIEALKNLDLFKPANVSQAASALVVRGKADQSLDRPAKAEAEWKDALKQYPRVGEAGWLLLQLYYMEGRNDELRTLAIVLHKNETDPQDRVRLLLEPIRPDAEPLAAAGVIPAFKNVVKNNPDDIFAALAYYRALAKDGTGIDEALQGLRALVQRHPNDLACLDGLMFAMEHVGDLDGMAKTVAALPKDIESGRRLARYRGLLAENRRDYLQAIDAYKIALEDDPSDREILHRLGEVAKLAGKTKEAEAAKVHEADIEAARVELRGIKGQEAQEGRIGLFEDAITRPNFGKNPDPDFYKKLAAIRERMGHPDEALAWHELVLKDSPEDAQSREAVKRLRKAP